MANRLVNSYRWARIAMITALCVMLFELVIAFTPARKRIEKYTRLVRLWSKFFLWGNSYNIEGKNLIPENEAVIFASNHQSAFDIPLLCALVPVHFRWMSKTELFSVPFLGRALTRMGTIEVIRDKKRKAGESAKKAVGILKSGESVLIFPEGTWGDAKGRMRPFKKGVINIARESGAKVLPITIVGSSQVNPPDSGEINYGDIKLIIHPAMAPESWEGVSDEEWLNRLRDTIGGPLPYGTDVADTG